MPQHGDFSENSEDFDALVQVHNVAKAARDKYFTKISKTDKLENEINEHLDRIFKKLVWSAIGADNRFGRIELNEKAPGWKHIEPEINRMALEMLQSRREDIEGVVTSDNRFNRELVTIYRKHYKSAISKIIKEQAEAKAQVDATKIVQAVATDEDRFVKLAEDIIGDADPDLIEIAERTKLGQSFRERAIVSSVKVVGIVSIGEDGWFSSRLSDPSNPAWFAIQLHDGVEGADIVSDGDAWHPARIVGISGEIDYGKSKIIDHFERTSQQIFAYMGMADRVKIRHAIQEYLKTLEDLNESE